MILLQDDELFWINIYYDRVLVVMIILEISCFRGIFALRVCVAPGWGKKWLHGFSLYTKSQIINSLYTHIYMCVM